MLAADGCASSSSNPAYCFCGVQASGGPGEWRSPFSGFHWFGACSSVEKRAFASASEARQGIHCWVTTALKLMSS